VLLPHNFDAIGGAIFGGHVGNEAFAHPPPTGFLAPPFNPTAGPRQLLAIVQSATGANNPVAEMTAWALDNGAMGQRMQIWLTIQRLSQDRQIHRLAESVRTNNDETGNSLNGCA
jgi:hypothetical protein